MFYCYNVYFNFNLRFPLFRLHLQVIVTYCSKPNKETNYKLSNLYDFYDRFFSIVNMYWKYINRILPWHWLQQCLNKNQDTITSLLPLIHKKSFTCHHKFNQHKYRNIFMEVKCHVLLYNTHLKLFRKF